jgi:hypothetical protein
MCAWKYAAVIVANAALAARRLDGLLAEQGRAITRRLALPLGLAADCLAAG